MNQTLQSPSLVASQRWKLWLFASLLTVSGVGLFAPNHVASAVGASLVTVNLGSTALGLIVLVSGMLSVRCPACRLSLVWYALSKQGIHAWLSWLLDIRVCPRCGFSHSSSRGGSHEKSPLPTNHSS